MLNRSVLTVLVAALIGVMFTADAMGMMHARLGRFMQRDMNGEQIGHKARVDFLEGDEFDFEVDEFDFEVDGFVSRDSIDPFLKYQDGMSLYASYFAFKHSLDPEGLACTGCGNPANMAVLASIAREAARQAGKQTARMYKIFHQTKNLKKKCKALYKIYKAAEKAASVGGVIPKCSKLPCNPGADCSLIETKLEMIMGAQAGRFVYIQMKCDDLLGNSAKTKKGHKQAYENGEKQLDKCSEKLRECGKNNP